MQWEKVHCINKNNIIERKCGKCGEWLEENTNNFYMVNKSKPEKGFLSWCKQCMSKSNTNRQKKKGDEYSKYQKEYRNKGNNRQIVNERSKQWREDNQEWKQIYQLDYQRKYPEKMYEYAKNRIAHKKHNITKKEWLACLKYFNHRCAYCGLPMEDHYNMYLGKLRWENLQKEHVDHEGENDITNCVPSCKSCNDRKWKYIFDEWYSKNNPNYTEERYNKIIKWLIEDCFKYIEEKKIQLIQG